MRFEENYISLLFYWRSTGYGLASLDSGSSSSQARSAIAASGLEEVRKLFWRGTSVLRNKSFHLRQKKITLNTNPDHAFVLSLRERTFFSKH